MREPEEEARKPERKESQNPPLGTRKGGGQLERMILAEIGFSEFFNRITNFEIRRENGIRSNCAGPPPLFLLCSWLIAK